MDLYIEREELSRGLAHVQGIVERRSTSHVGSHVLLHAVAGKGLRMTATDTEIAFLGDLAANVSASGQLAVDAANLFQVVRSLPEASVHLGLASGGRLEVRSGRSVFRLPAISAEEYPPIPPFEVRSAARISEGALRRVIEQVHYAVSTDDVRYGLNGAYLQDVLVDGAHQLRLVATDGHRLSAAQAPIDAAVTIPGRMLVPRKALGVMRRILDGGDAEVEMAFGEHAIRISRPGLMFWFRMLEGEFPDYESVLPTDFKHRIVVRTNEFSSALRRVLIVVQDRSRAVRFDFAADELHVDVQNVDRGEVRESIPTEIEGAPIVVGFNARYLHDVLSVLPGERVQLELAHPLAPCLMRNPDDNGAFFVVMPMRID